MQSASVNFFPQSAVESSKSIGQRVKKLYFVGICGTAMGSVAAAFQRQGYEVLGSDHAIYPPMSDVLRDCGVRIFEGYKADNIPTDADLYVIGNAVSRGNPEVEAILTRKLPYASMAEVLKWEVMFQKRNFVVTGTHGKTTTTSMLTWILEDCGCDPGYMIGGVPGNFEVGARFNTSENFVIEGDEYDSAFFDKRSKFLHYNPDVLIVNNIEFDHADIFATLDDILLSFTRLLRIVSPTGCILLNGDLETCCSLERHAFSPVQRVGFGDNCQQRLAIVQAHQNSTEFSINGVSFTVPMIGEFNVRNAAMAVLAARQAGLEDAKIRRALLRFEGVKRRQTELGEVVGRMVIDDFGHHPTAIRETLKGLRQRFPQRRLWAVFEPRSNTSMRNVMQEALINALKCADACVIAEVPFPEKIAIAERLNVAEVQREVSASGILAFHEQSVDAIVERLRIETREGDVVILFSNGGFGGIHQKLLTQLR